MDPITLGFTISVIMVPVALIAYFAHDPVVRFIGNKLDAYIEERDRA
jgi:hypothetical protein